MCCHLCDLCFVCRCCLVSLLVTPFVSIHVSPFVCLFDRRQICCCCLVAICPLVSAPVCLCDWRVALLVSLHHSPLFTCLPVWLAFFCCCYLVSLSPNLSPTLFACEVGPDHRILAVNTRIALPVNLLDQAFLFCCDWKFSWIWYDMIVNFCFVLSQVFLFLELGAI